MPDRDRYETRGELIARAEKAEAEVARLRGPAEDARREFAEAALDLLQEFVARWHAYRIEHDVYGDGSRRSGYAWDQVSKTEAKAKALLAAERAAEEA